MTRKRGVMNEALARSALDQISELDLAEKVTFHVMGEPLLHPGFLDILDHARARNLPVGLTTNGALLNPQTIKALAERDLHQIDISLQTPDEDSFLATRGTRMDFEDYRARVLDLLVVRAARPSPPIFKIRIMTTSFAKQMRDELGIPNFMGSSKALRNSVREWAQIIYRRLGPSCAAGHLAQRLKKIGIHGWNVIEISPNIFIETYVLTDWGNAFSGADIVEAAYGYCFGMRDHFAILYSGEVVLCCVDFDGRTSLGSLKDSSLLEILSGAELERVMRGFRRGRLVNPYCRRCLGSNSRIGSWIKPVVSILGLKVLKPFFYRKYRLFD